MNRKGYQKVDGKWCKTIDFTDLITSTGGIGAGIRVKSPDSAVLDLGSGAEGSFGVYDLEFVADKITGKTMIEEPKQEFSVSGTVTRSTSAGASKDVSPPAKG